MFKTNFILLFFISPVAFSKSLVVDLNKEISSAPDINLFAVLKDSEVKKLSPLSRLKYQESRKQWDECIKKAPEVFANTKQIQPWILQSWFNCALRKYETQKQISILQRPISVLRKNIHFLDRGPWKSGLVGPWIKANQWLWENSLTEKKEKKRKELQEAVRENLFLRSDLLSSDQRAFYLGWNTNGEVPKGKRIWASDSLNPEKELQAKIQTEVDQKNNLKAVTLMVEFLKKFPGSSEHKRMKDRLLDVSSDFFEKENPEREKVLSLLLDLDSDKLSELAAWAHRRAFYAEAALFAEKALQNLKGMAALNPLYVLSRSQLFLGQYDGAKKNFQSLAQQYSGTEEAAEAFFRLGLLHFRLANYELAKDSFESVLALNRDKFELNSRYWLVRCLEALKSPSALDEKHSLIDDYPFSYYTLKLKAELKLPISEGTEMKELPKVRIEFFGDQVETWNRIKLLTKSGWLLEAQAELNSLPSPQRADVQIVWANFLLNRHQYPQAIRLINQAMDQDSQFKDWSFLKRSFPLPYLDMIQNETKKYSLHPYVIQSLIRQESAFGLKAISSSNALGLMQMIPPTAN